MVATFISTNDGWTTRASLLRRVLVTGGTSPSIRKIDSELQKLDGDFIGGVPLLTYLRYNAGLDAPSIANLLKEKAIEIPSENLSAMDAPENMDALHKIGLAAGERDVKREHFPATFNLK